MTTFRPPPVPRTREQCWATDLSQSSSGRIEAFESLARDAGLSETDLRRGKGSVYEGIGTLDAQVVVRVLPKAQVAELLPLGLQLAPQPLVGPDKHPVFFLFAHDTFEAWFGDMDYRELMIGVPYVQLVDPYAPNRGPFIYMPRLYLNAEVPRVLGNRLYGFEKLPGRIDATSRDCRVYLPTTHELLAAFEHRSAGAPVHPSEIANFDIVRQVFEMSTVSQSERIFDADAFADRNESWPFLCTDIVYDFAGSDCTIEPLTGRLQLTDRLTPAGLPPGHCDVPSLLDDPLGAFRLKVRQVVKLPGSCAEAHYPRPAPFRRRKVVVLGGGPAACATAFYLAQQRDRYEVSMYTQGWRLGGKCAAARNPDKAYRIEEHGLHAFIGFYQNAFRTLREVYDVADLPIDDGPSPRQRFGKAFVGQENVGIFDRWDGRWQYFRTPQAFNDKVPGEIPDQEWDYPPFFSAGLVSAFRQVMKHMTELLGNEADDEFHVQQTYERQRAPQTFEEQSLWDKLVDEVKDRFDLERLGLQAALDKLVDYIEDLAIERLAEDIEEGRAYIRGLGYFLETTRTTLKKAYEARIAVDPESWFVWTNLDLVLTILIGIITDRAVHFDQLDHLDFRAWLLGHGLDPSNAQLATINQVYETLFAHGSDQVEPDCLACGVALRWFVLVGFLYTGYPAYDFKYSCPQTMLTPYYIALEQLGVEVNFFHRVEELLVEGSGDDRRLAGVRLQVQATVEGGPAAYRPLLPVLPNNPSTMPDWPNRPHYDQLVEGERIRVEGIDLENVWSGWPGAGEKTLRQGVDFDLCVLGIPVGVFPKIAKRLIDPDSESFAPAWKDMVDGMAVTKTISSQLWINRPAAELYGWPIGLTTCYAQPEPSMADFSHLIAWEQWSGPTTPEFLAYHTGSLTAISVHDGYPTTTADYPAREAERWRSMFADWLKDNYRSFYDLAPRDYQDFLDLLAVPSEQGQTGEQRLAEQYFNIGIQPSDLYVLSQPGKTKLRLGQSESWVRDLFLCGDWTRTDLNCGCVEASTQSGMLAARAISNQPAYVWHPGF